MAASANRVKMPTVLGNLADTLTELTIASNQFATCIPPA